MTSDEKGASAPRPSGAQGPAPHADASASTRVKAPPNSCDCHIHIYDTRFPAHSGPGGINFPVSEYRLCQQRISTTRTVITTPKTYVTDNTCTLDAIAQLGATRARGVAVLHPDVTDDELRRLADGGIRGIRFTVENPAQAVTSIEMIEPLAQRVNELGWHVQIHMRADQIVAHAELLQRLAAPIVFDHLGRLPDVEHAAFRVIRGLLDRGRTWVKLSGTPFRYGADYMTAAEQGEIARAYISAAPERLVWGSDWPHRSDKQVPDDALRFSLFVQWARDERTLQRILVANPQALYGFAPAD